MIRFMKLNRVQFHVALRKPDIQNIRIWTQDKPQRRKVPTLTKAISTACKCKVHVSWTQIDRTSPQVVASDRTLGVLGFYKNPIQSIVSIGSNSSPCIPIVTRACI